MLIGSSLKEGWEILATGSGVIKYQSTEFYIYSEGHGNLLGRSDQ